MVMGSKYLKLAFDKIQATLIFSLYARDKMNEIYYAIYTTYISGQGGGGVYGYSEQWQSLNQMVRMKAKSTMEDVKALKAAEH